MSEHRLVTLTGSGGCGKTRLAVEAAGDRPRAVWVDLAPLADAGLLVQTMSVALGIPDGVDDDPTETLIAALTEQDVLLVLDNCEHLVEEVALLVDVLPSAVLATSREPLAVDGEAVYRVRSLATGDAVQLFEDRAARAGTGEIASMDDPAVREICTRLDGIPLAIELAAARMRMMTARQIAELLDDRFGLLAGGSRTALARQRTLEASISWSYDLLAEDERTLLRQLSVFRSSFGLAAAADVSGYGDAVLDVLTRLIDRSLVESMIGRDRARYRLLESVREFAHRELIAHNEVTEKRDRHLCHFLGAAEAREPLLAGPEMLYHVAQADAEQADVRAGLDWASASGQTELALRLAGSQWVYWMMRALPREGRSRLEAALAEGPDAPPQVRFKALLAILTLCRGNDWQSAVGFAEQAVEAADRTESDGLRSQAFAWRGQARLIVGDKGGFSDQETSLLLARAAGDPSHLIRSLHWLGAMEAQVRDLALGVALLDEAIALASETANDLQLGWALGWRARAARMQGQPQLSTSFAARSVDLLRKRGERDALVLPLSELSLALAFQGRQLEAEAAALRAFDALEPTAAPGYRAFACLASGSAHWLAGALAEAERVLLEGQELLERSGSWAYSALFAVLRGRIAGQGGQRAIAERLLLEGRDRAGDVDFARCDALIGLCYLRLDEQRFVEAVGLAREAVELAAARGQTLHMTNGLTALAEAIWTRGEHDDAAHLLATAESTRERLGHVAFPDMTQRVAPLLTLARRSPGWDRGASSSLEETVAWASRGRGPRGRPASGWDSLTPTELEVAQLVAQGLSNPEVAEALFISRNTVKAHLAHIYSKLDLTTRAALATQVARHLAHPEG